MTRSNRGIIYVVTGRRHSDEACRSAAQAKRMMPELPITIFTDQNLDGDLFDQVIRIPQASGFLSKVVNIRRSPYRDTLFLDSDTHIVGDVSSLFELLDRFDLAAAHAPYRITYNVDAVPDCFPELNTGVLVYRSNNKTDALWDHWIHLYKEDLAKQLTWRFPGGELMFRGALADQPSFRKAVYQSDVAVTMLPPEYNCRLPFPGFLHSKAQIIHGRSKNLDADASILNKVDIPRVHLMRWGRLKTFHSSMPPISSVSRLLWSLHHRGLLGSIEATIERIRSSLQGNL